MSDETCESIEIQREIPFFGEGDSLANRLRQVSLKGFPDVNIYRKASFDFRTLTPKEVIKKICTPQPSIYRTHLNRIQKLDELFMGKGIDILKLDMAYDFLAVSEEGVETEWTMISPIVERFYLPSTNKGNVDYSTLIGNDLIKALCEKKLGVNSQIHNMKHPMENGWVNEINDGSHRVHYGVEERREMTLLVVSGMTPGFPYYAVPQEYSVVRVHDKRDDDAIETKIHVLDSPGHKLLYRLFPSGGIKSGDVRFDPKLKNI